jgi:hypothetical protein
LTPFQQHSDEGQVIGGVTQVLPFADWPALSLYRQFERGIYDAVNAA